MKKAKRLTGNLLKILGEHCLEDIPKTSASGRNYGLFLFWPELPSTYSNSSTLPFLCVFNLLFFLVCVLQVTRDQMKVFIQQEFKKVQKVIADEEQKALHLVDIQEAMATAHVTEILADIQSHMDRLMTQMAQAKEQLDTSNESAEPKAEVKEKGINCPVC